MNELDLLSDYLIENNFASSYEDAIRLISVMSEGWMEEALYEQINYLYENTKYKGKYNITTGKWEKVKKKRTPLTIDVKQWDGKTRKFYSPEVVFSKSARAGLPPAAHSTGGSSRGVRLPRGGARPQPETVVSKFNRARGDRADLERQWGNPRTNRDQRREIENYLRTSPNNPLTQARVRAAARRRQQGR